MTIRSRMSLIMEPIGQELSELSALELENLPYLTLFIGHIEPECLELFALEFGKIAENDFVYTLSSTNINQSASKLVKVYMTIRSRMNLIMKLIGLELSQLSALELENLPYLTLFTH